MLPLPDYGLLKHYAETRSRLYTNRIV